MKKTYKTVGIIGGLGPESTSLFYNELIRLVQERQNGQYPQMIINSLDLWHFVSLMNKKEKLIEYVVKEIHKIEQNVDFITFPCNTVHFVLNEIRERINKPVLAIQETVALEVAKNKCKYVGIIGTKATLKKDFYKSELIKHNIQSIKPKNSDLKKLDSLIFNSMLYGKNKEDMKQLLLRITSQFARNNCDGIILACSELPLFISKTDSSMKIFPSTNILAEATFNEIFSSK